MTDIYLIRHAEAEGNIFRRLHGQYDSGVTANGLRQIAALEKRFADIPIDGVWSSDLCRTRRTAQAICAPKGLPLHPEPRFREVHVGTWEDRTFGDLERSEPAALYAFAHDPENWTAPGAETYAEYSGRFAAALTELAEANPGKTLAVFTHGCVLSGGLHRLLGLPHDASRADNTSVSLLRYENGAFTPVFLYDNSHLSEEISTRARQRWWRQQGGKFNLWFREASPADAARFDAVWSPAPEDKTRTAGLGGEAAAPAPVDRVWIASLGEEPVGWAAVSDTALSALYLRPEFRHRRMGDQLFGQAMLYLRRKGVEALRFAVPASNPEAISFFTHLGAVPVQSDNARTVFCMNISIPRLIPDN
jgi:probable phosphoglycerate mutase